MDPIKVNLSTSDHIGSRTIALMAVFAAGILIVSVINSHLFVRNSGKILDYNEKIARIERILKNKAAKKKRKEFGKKELLIAGQRTVLLNRLIAKDVFPWNRLLEMLENKVPDGLTIQSFTPSNDFGSFIVKGRAVSAHKVSSFLKQLQEWDLSKQNTLLALSIESKSSLNNSGEKKFSMQFTIESKLKIDDLFVDAQFGGIGRILTIR